MNADYTRIEAMVAEYGEMTTFKTTKFLLTPPKISMKFRIRRLDEGFAIDQYYLNVGEYNTQWTLGHVIFVSKDLTSIMSIPVRIDETEIASEKATTYLDKILALLELKFKREKLGPPNLIVT